MTDDQLDQLIIATATRVDAVAEACRYVDYDPDIGRVPEHWEPRLWVRAIARAAIDAALADQIPRNGHSL